MVSELEQLAPGFLVAAPSMVDPNFDHTVVLMCAHNEHGAMGLVINREAPITLGEIMRQLEMETAAEHATSALFGGPVALESALLLYQREEALLDHLRPHGVESDQDDDEMSVGEGLLLSPGKRLLERIARCQGPRRVNLFLGHSGWAPGQLEREIAQGAWLPVSLDLELIFTVPLEERWDRALQLGGFSMAALGFGSSAN
ncbi:MAG: hypothetical protein CSB49_01540 [Proteobacteria bacterium]|nr:MAG: hypothetical protein CSB49_01540 [Pseudomonadota bacterium]